MNYNVKTFIEQNIDFINSEDWASVFRLWSYEYAPNTEPDDYAQLRELFSVLEVIDPAIKQNSQEARYELVIEQMQATVRRTLNTGRHDTISMAAVIIDLNSRLFCGLVELKSLFCDACTELGLEPASDTRLRFKLR